MFANDGTGTRGNLAAVVKAILLDYEARSPTLLGGSGYGKLKEPLLRMTGIYRAFGAAASDGRYAIFSSPDEPRPGGAPLADGLQLLRPRLRPAGLPRLRRAPRPGIPDHDASTAISVPNNIYSAIYTPTPPAATTIALNLSSLTANATNPTAMVATLNQLLCANMMTTQTQQIDLSALMSAPGRDVGHGSRPEALYLAATSPDAAIQR